MWYDLFILKCWFGLDKALAFALKGPQLYKMSFLDFTFIWLYGSCLRMYVRNALFLFPKLC